ncbi:MAG TPA: TolC family outer membrane protein [Dongiaceae bacterium]|nr:TolC family outer membrane protein [Dongiaceae bacterium]
MKFGAISLRRTTLLLSTAAVFGLTGLSTGASALTLQEAVGLVIATNPEVGVTVKDRRAIDFELRQARALYYPQIDVRLDAGINFSENETTDTGNDRTNQGIHDHGRWLYGQRDAQVTLQQRIFDGFETDSEVERQKSRIVSAGHRIQDQGQVSALDATQAYLDVLRHTERVTNAEANVAAHEDTLGLVQRRAELGGGNVADVRQAEARLATARTALEEIQGDLRDARAVFQRVVGVEAQDLEPVVLDGAMIAASEEESIARALQTNPKILLAQADVEVAGHEIDKEAAPLYPRLDLEVIGNNNRHNNGREDTTYSATFLLVARYNLYRGGADLARVREFKWRKAEAQERLRVEERGVAEDVRLSWSARDTQRNSVATLQDQVEANQNTRDVYAQQFDIGQRSLLDLLDATNELFLSKNDLITAQYEELFANYRILASQGELVQAMGVAFPKEATPGEVDDFETVAPGDPAN